MARIVPDNWQKLRTGARPQLARRLDALAELSGLPEGFTVYHDVQWNGKEGAGRHFGSVDFAIVSPRGAVLLIEQHSGYLVEDGSGLIRRGRHLAEIAHGLGRSAAAIRAGLPGAALDVLLHLPDYTVIDRASVAIDATAILDASSAERLLDRVGSRLATLDAGIAVDRERAAAANRYFSDSLRLVVDIGSQIGSAEKLYTRLSGGLTEWARRIHVEPHRVRISATAGSGKTQLALSLFEEAIREGRRVIFVCFNRPLADHFARLAPEGGLVASYLQLCNRMVRSTGLRPDFSEPDAFERIALAFAAMAVPEEFRVDELIVDEGQDFSAPWRDSLMRLLKPEGRAWWLEDGGQNLYGREPVPLPGWVTLTSPINYRSPAEIVALLNRLRPEAKIEAGSPVEGQKVSLFRYRGREDLLEKTRRAVTEAIGLGFSREQIVILSFRGRERSLLAPLDRLGPIALRHFSGGYDAEGNPQFTAGDVLCETVYRFKGQSAPCVILTEIDAPALDEACWRKIFVGATRATLKLSVVASGELAQIFAQTLENGL
jgi:hypothetical protein